ncbi:MFS transporter [Myxococcus sp. XM-1-1-1]|jgi:MFS family permease|uniref:MFS transporter n=1 Tax=Myxococcus sp. XM-1-1-1 TaxID=2874602 RepID=UPI001CBA9378|nr:MFS transporter [Myxococcus sp. XM-1-1-1]MBZ4410714.1 MFS transporter [Myxococcus sp. XM-1-1-1]
MRTAQSQARQEAARHLLSARDIRTLALASLGGALEFYDFIIFVFFTVVIGMLFFPADMVDWLRQLQVFGVFAAGYLARPLGGIIMAHFGDRVGRKRMFTLSVFMMAVPTLLIGLLPTYAMAGHAAPLALLVLRILQGAAVGGEVPGAWVFVAEHVPERRVGLACGTLCAGLSFGILLGTLVATAVNKGMAPQDVLTFGWRLPFLAGGVFGLLAVLLRRWLSESPVFEELRQRKALVQELPLKVVLRGHGAGVIVSVLLTALIAGGLMVVILMAPTLMQSLYNLPAIEALEAGSAATLSLTLGCVAFGLLADRLGPARALGLGCLAMAASTYALYLGVGSTPERLTALSVMVGFCAGVVGVVPTVMVRVFPAAVRYSGLSFSYNVSNALVGGLTPLVITLLIKTHPLAPAHYIAALCGLSLGVSLYLGTAGRARFADLSPHGRHRD